MRPFVQCPPALPPTSPLWDHCPPTPRQESIICWCHCWVEGGGLWVTLLCTLREPRQLWLCPYIEPQASKQDILKRCQEYIS